MTSYELESRLEKWHVDKYGISTPDYVRTALKGCEEMGEIAKAILKGDTSNLLEEIADVYIILLHMCRGLKVNIVDVASKKLPIIEERLKKQKGMR